MMIFLCIGLFVLGIGVGYLLSLYFTPKYFKKKLDNVYKEFESDIMAETERQRQVQDAITREYQKAVQESIYQHLMATGEAPAREDMN